MNDDEVHCYRHRCDDRCGGYGRCKAVFVVAVGDGYPACWTHLADAVSNALRQTGGKSVVVKILG